MIPERLLITGLDSGVLDPKRGWDGARPALAALARLRVPLVLCSTRPRTELTAFSRLFGLDAPMIVENGAALLVPHGHLPGGLPDLPSSDDHHVLTLGPGRDALRETLAALARAAGVRVRGVSTYEYTEPFLLENAQDEQALAAQAERRGLRVVHGPRYLHLCDGSDKGLAVRTLLSLYERSGPPPRAIGIGAWPTDVSLLRAVQRALILPADGRGIRADVAAAAPKAIRWRTPGADGWSDAVIAELTGREPASAQRTLKRRPDRARKPGHERATATFPAPAALRP